MTADDSPDAGTRPESDEPLESQYPTDVLVSPEWVESRLGRFDSAETDARLLEVDVNTAFYETGHAPGAVCVDWQEDLRSADAHDILGPQEMESFLGACGITEETTVVVYGDNSNWFATHLYWQFTMYGHDDVRVMDGGREYWMEHDFPTSDAVPSFPTTEYRVDETDESIRAFRQDVYEALDDDTTLVDVRMPEEYRGELTAPPGMDETAQRAGHIPGAINVLWADNVDADGRFKSPAQLEALYESYGVTPEDEVVAYCRIGERSSITWFVLHELLGYEAVRNYDGSWTEWGNLIRAPIAVGDEE